MKDHELELKQSLTMAGRKQMRRVVWDHGQ